MKTVEVRRTNAHSTPQVFVDGDRWADVPTTRIPGALDVYDHARANVRAETIARALREMFERDGDGR